MSSLELIRPVKRTSNDHSHDDDFAIDRSSRTGRRKRGMGGLSVSFGDLLRMDDAQQEVLVG